MFQRKYPLVLVMSILLLFIFTACGGSIGNKPASLSEEQTLQTIEHELGASQVPLAPQRVIVLEQGFAELIAELGVIPVGVADDGKPERLPQALLKKIEGYTSVGRRSEPNLEVMRSLKPDLIIADVTRHQNSYKEFSMIAPTIALKSEIATYEDSFAIAATIGKALGKEKEAEQLLEEHRNRVEEFKSGIGTDRSLLIAGAGDNGSALFDVRSTTYFTPSFFAAQGIPYALKENKETSYEMTVEQLLRINPDILIISINEDRNSVIEELKDNRLWNRLDAVKNGAVYEVSHSDWSRRRTILAVNEILPDAAKMLSVKSQ